MSQYLMRLVWLQACVKEALRVYPPATAVGRQLGEDVVVEGRTIPKGIGIMVGLQYLFCAQIVSRQRLQTPRLLFGCCMQISGSDVKECLVEVA
jgi:hypothetical protein